MRPTGLLQPLSIPA
jgi:hypothetical protein